MADVLTTQLVTGFAPFSGSVPVVIESDPSLYGDLDVHLLAYPHIGLNFAVTLGSFFLEGVKPVVVPTGMITFSGGRTATLPKKPIVSNPTFKVEFAFDLQGNPVPAGVSYNSETQQVEATQSIHAAVSYTSYQTLAQMIRYTPVVESYGGGTKTTFGTIAAFHPPKGGLTIYEIPPFNVDDGDLEFELYRRVTYAVTTPEGEFEMPPNYPSSGEYTNPADSLVLDISTSMKSQRVHEIGTMNLKGYGRVKNFYVEVKEPYVGNSTYINNVLPGRIEYVEAQLPKTDKQGNPIDKSLIEKAKNFIASKGYGK